MIPPPTNPYESPLVPLTPGVALLPAEPQRRPRVWTAFVAVVAAFAAVIVGQIAATIALVAWHFAEGGTAGDLQAKLMDLITQPAMFIALGLLGQLMMLFTALVAAWLSPQPLALRLGLVQPATSVVQIGILIAGVLVPFAIGMSLAYALAEVIDPDPSVAAMYEKMTLGMALPFLLFIALAPGFTEELLFRGYVQRRLVERWGAGVAIVVTSLIFALFHIMPHAVAFAFPVGIWLGMLAWKTGSVWPGIICHALINGLWNVWQLGVRFDYFAEQPPVVLLVVLAIVGVAAFGASLWLMFQAPREQPSKES